MIQRFIRVRDTQLEAQESEGDGPLVFMLHGNSSSAATFAGALASEAGRRFKLVSLSLPGHGASSPARTPDAEYSVPALAGLLREVIAGFGAGSYALVGHSLGGHVFSHALPSLQGAVGLVLISAPPLSAVALPQAFAPAPASAVLFKGELDEGEVDLLASSLLGRARTNEAIFAQLRRDIGRTDVHFRPALGKSIMAGQLADEVAIVAETRTPVAMLWGTEDVFLHRGYYETVRVGAAAAGGSRSRALATACTSTAPRSFIRCSRHCCAKRLVSDAPAGLSSSVGSRHGIYLPTYLERVG